ncbi:MAG: formate/nitrite transporter FocA (FNT family) [Salibacteraceae bacterium]|jgi:formate/nitrite transporter FocA (FNT family)
MDWNWLSVMLVGIVGAFLVTLLYHYKLKKHGRVFELCYAVGYVC